MIAERVSPPEIVAYLKEKYGTEISYQQIYWYRRASAWKKFIKEKRDLYDAAVDEERFASKRKRLIGCEEAYLVAKEKKDAKGMTMAIIAARQEMEGKRIALTDAKGDDFSFTINIGPPPDQVRPPKRIGPSGPVLTLRPPYNKDDDKED
jgi:hypothetical protein